MQLAITRWRSPSRSDAAPSSEPTDELGDTPGRGGGAAVVRDVAVRGACRVLRDVAVAVEHRARERHPRQVDGVGVPAPRARRGRDRRPGRGARGSSARRSRRPSTQTTRAPRQPAKCSLCPRSQQRRRAARVRLVVEREDLCQARGAMQKRPGRLIGGESHACLAARVDQRADVSAVPCPGVVAVVVRDVQVGVERLDQGAVQLASVRGPGVSGALARAVQEVRQDLVGDEQPQQLARAYARQGPEQRRAVDVGALALDRRERVVTERVIRDARRDRAPVRRPRGIPLSSPTAARGSRRQPGRSAPGPTGPPDAGSG